MRAALSLVLSAPQNISPPIVALLERELPDVEVVLKVGNREATIASLARRELDLCIMGRPPREPLVDATSLVEHPHIVIAPADHPLAGASEISPGDLLEERFVMREEGSGTRMLGTRFLDDLGHGKQVRIIEMVSNETIKQAVINGLGIAIISAHTVAEELKAGRLVALKCPGMPVNRTWFILTRSDYEPSPAAIRVRDWIIAHTADFFPKLEF